MTPTPVRLIVLSSRQDDVEYINRVLREAGHAAQCHWVAKLEALGDAIRNIDPQLLWMFCDNFKHDIGVVAQIRSKSSRALPVIAVSNEVCESAASEAMAAGAHDLISTQHKERVCAVARRELRSFHLERALTKSLHSARQYRERLESFTADSDDAIAHATDGILVDANKAWEKLLGRPLDEMMGPIMDLFDPGSHTPIKGALVASVQGQWKGEPLKVHAIAGDGSRVPLALRLEHSIFDGEPAVKLSVLRRPVDTRSPQKLMEDAILKDPGTGLYIRQHLIALLKERLVAKQAGGVRTLACIRPDKFGDIANDIGPLASEDILIQLAGILRESVNPNDVYGRFEGNVFLVWLERGTFRDVEAWAGNVLSRVSDTIFEAAHNTLSMTCTIGIADCGPNSDDLDHLIRGALRASARGRQRGGNQVVFEETSDESTRIQRFDELWVQQIKNALVENRFQLSRLSLACLNGAPENLYDTSVRMIDEQGDEVAASTFVPVAARNNLLRTVDRWIIDTALRMSCAADVDCLFVRLSSSSLTDDSLLPWLTKQIQEAEADAGNVCMQVAEETANQHLKQTIALAHKLRSVGFKFAIEHFGIGRDPLRVLSQIPMDYVKIDGSLMPGISGSSTLQEKVTSFVEAAKQREIVTIAERVEDANTMAVLFQLGFGYVQGHLVQELDVVLEDAV